MKIFSAPQIKKWDAFTIKNEPISSINLMERAATACYNWLVENNLTQHHFKIFCGKGNNGGDGLAIARLLLQNNCKATVYILEFGKLGSDDFQANLEKLHLITKDIHFIQSEEFFPALHDGEIIIDAIFGSGLNKPLDGFTAGLAKHINNAGVPTIAIDFPTGLFADKSSNGNIVINATHTLSFQNKKLAFFLPKNEIPTGKIHLLNIGLHKNFEIDEYADFEMLDSDIIKSIYKRRSQFSNKGTYGNAAIVSGSIGMMGAAVLSSQACLRSGVGKITAYIPKCGYNIIQTAVPEAMAFVAGEECILSAEGVEKFNTVGIGPGIGVYPEHKKLLTDIFASVTKPMVIDADALNVISENKELLQSIPPLSILTPHPKEFERLFGKTESDFERLQLALEKSRELNIYIVLKGHYTFISTPEGKGYFNSTGNAGMATAGSGDVLTGIITGLLAQEYSSLHAALLGVYLHGLAGDIAAAKYSQEAMIAGDITTNVGTAFKHISAY